MWDIFNFKESPYDSRPLSARPEDVDLLIGREEEMVDLFTIIDSRDHGALIVSGDPGVGKTSFINVSQIVLERGETFVSKKILANRELCPIQDGDSSRDVARRALRAMCRSVQRFCEINNKNFDGQASTTLKWLDGAPTSSWGGSISIFGNGGGVSRSVTLPSSDNASFESIKDAIEAVSSEAVHQLGFDSMFIVLDNTENIADEKLASFFMSFRDTLFVAPNVWWIIIGQRGLGSSLRSIDARVAERMSGTIELSPIDADELHEVISQRVRQFHSSGAGEAPLSKEFHENLYEVTDGEIRFIFQKSSDVCTRFISLMRAQASKNTGINVLTRFVGFERERFERFIHNLIEDTLVGNQIGDDLAEEILKTLVEEEIEGLNFTQKQKDILKKIGERGSARSGEYKDFSLKSGQDFSSNFLVKFFKMGLLRRSQAGTAVQYTLRGNAALAYRFELL